MYMHKKENMYVLSGQAVKHNINKHKQKDHWNYISNLNINVHA